MNSIISSILFISALLSHFVTCSPQTEYTVWISRHGFEPSSLSISTGDSVTWYYPYYQDWIQTTTTDKTCTGIYWRDPKAIYPAAFRTKQVTFEKAGEYYFATQVYSEIPLVKDNCTIQVVIVSDPQMTVTTSLQEHQTNIPNSAR